MSRCSQCVYSCAVDMGDGGELMRACVYILHQGKRRPCPAGEACAVFRPGQTRQTRNGDVNFLFEEVG